MMFAEGEMLEFPLVGSRNYVRAVDLVGMVEARIGDFARQDIRFVRPLVGRAMISSSRAFGAAVELVIRRHDRSQTYYLYDRGPGDRIAEEDSVLSVTLIEKRRLGRRYIVEGAQSQCRLLATIFERFQNDMGSRFVLRSLGLTNADCRAVEEVDVELSGETGGSRYCRISRSGVVWCELSLRRR